MSGKAWTTPADLREQIQRLWDAGRLLRGDLLFPLRLPLRHPDSRALAARFEEVRQWIRNLEAGAGDAGAGYQIEWEEANHRQLGRNRIPVRVAIPDEAAALDLIGRRAEAERFRSLARTPELVQWLARKPLTALAHAEKWGHFLAVLAWFQAHPQSGLYLRQVDIPGVDTKFIENHKALLAELLDIVLPETDPGAIRSFEERYGLIAKLPQIRFRILDRSLTIQGLTDLAVTAPEFAQLELAVDRVFITENEINGLAFPDVPRSMVIFGLGYGLERLHEAKWLRSRRIHYWGDIDSYGFHILDQLRAIFPAADSLLMDSATLEEHRALCVTEPTPFVGELGRLTDAEQAVYRRLGGLRLEQERIPFGWVRDAVQRAVAAKSSGL